MARTGIGNMARTGIGNMARTGTGPASYGHHSPGLWPLRDEIMLCTISGFTRSYRSVSWPSLPLRAVAHRLISDLDAGYQLRETVGWRNRETFDARSVPRRRSLARHRVWPGQDREHGENGDGPRVLWVSFDMEPIPLYFQPIHWDLPFGKLAFTPLASRGSSTDFGP
jgi:hypothetical protein